MSSNPFFPFGGGFDPTKFDPTKFDMSSLMNNVKLPGVDIQALLAAQAKNIEALTQANKAAMEGMQALAKRQMEILNQTMTETAKVVSGMTAVGDPREKVAQQTELAKTAFEQAIANMRELADMVQKSNREAADIITQRVSAGLEEVKNLAAKR